MIALLLQCAAMVLETNTLLQYREIITISTTATNKQTTTTKTTKNKTTSQAPRGGVRARLPPADGFFGHGGGRLVRLLRVFASAVLVLVTVLAQNFANVFSFFLLLRR